MTEMVRDHPLVSVVMAVHRGVDLSCLREAVQSILRQSFRSFEFLVIADGCLTDQQNSFIDVLAKQHNNIFFLSLEKNRGPGAARNHGIRHAKGLYIAIMDSDDIALQNRLQVEHEFLENNKHIAVVGSACQLIDSQGNEIGLRTLPTSPEKLAWYALFFCPLNNPTVMCRSNILREFLFDEHDRNNEDYRLWLSLISHGYKLANVDCSLLKFRTNPAQSFRRRGWKHAVSDFQVRVKAARIAPIYLAPFVLFFGCVIFLARLFSPSVVARLGGLLNYFRGGK